MTAFMHYNGVKKKHRQTYLHNDSQSCRLTDVLGVHRVLCSHWGILLLKALFLIDKIQLNANEVLEYLPVEGNCVLSDSSPGVIPWLLSWVVEWNWQWCPLKWDKLKLTQPRSCARNSTGETIGGSLIAWDHPLWCGNIDRYIYA